MIPGVTRSWPGQPDSNLDHCWMNTPGRLVYFKNIDRSFSDHNLILVAFKTKNKIQDSHEFTKRERKDFDEVKYVNTIRDINWDELFNTESLELMNDIFDTKIKKKVLDKLAPVKTVQRRRMFRNWVSQELKVEMSQRDGLRQQAKIIGDQEDWKKYRKTRNACVKSVKKCKEDYYKKLFEKMESKKTSKGLYSLTKELCGMKDGSTPQTFQQNGRIIRKQREMANLQMEYFVDKVEQIHRKIPITQRNPHRFIESAMESWQDKDERVEF